jgi:serine/threonine protein kinase
MTPERWRQMDRLFDEALDLPREKRERFVREACGDDAELLNELRGMLLAHDQSGGFFNEPALDNVAKRAASQGSEPDPAPATTLVGSTILHYRVTDEIGRGGMGVVYRATDTKLSRPVAIKVLSGDFALASERRFQREARMASSLNHPHILTVHDVGKFEERQYLVTEFVDGPTLRDWCKEKRTWRQVVDLLTGVADGLAAAHNAGILHRDVKPANILISKNGYAKLADFGLAKMTAPEQSSRSEEHTRTGVIMGTLGYMSPEQATGSPLDPRSDIFSFGVVMYEALAGARPFKGLTDQSVVNAILNDDPPPLDDKVPIALRMAVEKALEKDPAERYQTMRDMVVDLRRALRNDPREFKPPSKPSRNRWSAVAVGLAVAGFSVGYLIQVASRTTSPGTPAQRLMHFFESILHSIFGFLGA